MKTTPSVIVSGQKANQLIGRQVCNSGTDTNSNYYKVTFHPDGNSWEKIVPGYYMLFVVKMVKKKNTQTVEQIIDNFSPYSAHKIQGTTNDWIIFFFSESKDKIEQISEDFYHQVIMANSICDAYGPFCFNNEEFVNIHFSN